MPMIGSAEHWQSREIGHCDQAGKLGTGDGTNTMGIPKNLPCISEWLCGTTLSSNVESLLCCTGFGETPCFIMPETMEVSAAAKSGDGTTQNAAWSKGATVMQWCRNGTNSSWSFRNLADSEPVVKDEKL